MGTPVKPLTLERILSNCKPAGECLEWQGANTRGYGVLTAEGRLVYTHRGVWELVKGQIPKNLRVLHSCDNPPCANIHHLFLGTQKDNVQDSIAKGRHVFPVHNKPHTQEVKNKIRQSKLRRSKA